MVLFHSLLLGSAVIRDYFSGAFPLETARLIKVLNIKCTCPGEDRRVESVLLWYRTNAGS